VDGKSHELLDDLTLAPRDVPLTTTNGYWVVGDNERASDSRDLGAIARDRIKGVVVAVMKHGHSP
jgi:hypothetical protein